MKKILLVSFLMITSLNFTYAQSTNSIEHNQSIDSKIESDLNIYMSLIEVSSKQKNFLLELLNDRHKQVFNSPQKRDEYKSIYIMKIKENFKPEVYEKLFNDEGFNTKILGTI